MKNSGKTLAISLMLLGLFVVCFKSQGQGSVNFANTNFNGLDAPVTFNPGGIRLGSEFTADLLYSLDGGATYSRLTAEQSGSATYPTPFAFGIGADGDSANFAGYFFGNTVTIPGYSSGAVSFIVEAYHGASYAVADWKGQSAPFIIPSLATGLEPPEFFPADSMQPFSLIIPEPSVFALAGLGAVGLMAFRGKNILAIPKFAFNARANFFQTKITSRNRKHLQKALAGEGEARDTFRNCATAPLLF